MVKVNVYDGNDYKTVLESNPEIEFQNRMVAFLDVLGFKKKLETMDPNKIAETYRLLLGLVQHINNNLSRNGKKLCNLHIYSDSVILIANGDTDSDIRDFIVAVWKSMQVSIASKMPFRGGISYGPVFINEEEGIFLGNPIVHAVVLEGKQEWIGTICDKNAEKRINAIRNLEIQDKGFLNILLYEYDVPIKEEKFITCKAINWRFNFIVEDGISSLFEENSKNKSVKMKIDNTLKFSKCVKESGKLYLSDTASSELREKYPLFYIGKSKPPFNNGDDY